MNVYGPFSQEAHKIEQENIRMKKEIEMLKNELNKQNGHFQEKITELQMTNSKYQELLSKMEIMEKAQISLNYHIQELEKQNQILKEQCRTQQIEQKKLEKQANHCCCCCCQDRLRCHTYDMTSYQRRKSPTSFTKKVLNIVSDALNIDIHDAIDECDEKQQERIALKLLRRISSHNPFFNENEDEYQHEKFTKLKKKYQNKTEKCRELHDECDAYIQERKIKRKYNSPQTTRRTSSVKPCKQCFSDMKKLHEITKELKCDYQIFADIDRKQKFK